jgi:hypothetical protein
VHLNVTLDPLAADELIVNIIFDVPLGCDHDDKLPAPDVTDHVTAVVFVVPFANGVVVFARGVFVPLI